MIKKIDKPLIIKAAGNKPKQIEEYVGNANSGTPAVSVARMISQAGWREPGQTPEFDEYTIVLKGALSVKTKTYGFVLSAGQAIIVGKNEWVQYSTPYQGGAEYISVCLPAFSPETVHRDESAGSK